MRADVRLFGKGLFSKQVKQLVPRGHAAQYRLPVLATGIGVPDLEARAVPLSAYPQLTVLERITLKELFRRHLALGVDFDMQVSFAGGKTTPGGYAPDFLLFRYNIAIEVQGAVIHQGLLPTVRDEIKAMYEKSIGISEVLFLDEATLRSDLLTQQWFKRELNL